MCIRDRSNSDFSIFNDCVKKAKEEIDKKILEENSKYENNLTDTFNVVDYLAKDLETLREENSYLESTDRYHIKIEANQSYEDTPIKHGARDYEKIAKSRSPRTISIDYCIANTKLSKRVYEMPLKLDTSSELYIRINGKASGGCESHNVNYSSAVDKTNFTSQVLAELPSHYKSKSQGLEETPVITFKSQRNDIPTYINERKHLNLSKTDNRMLTDIYNEVLNQMQNLSKTDMNSSLECGDSLSFNTDYNEILESNRRGAEDDVAIELECPQDHEAISLKAFPVANSGLQLLSTIRSYKKLQGNDLDEWLEKYKLNKAKPILKRAAITSIKALTEYLGKRSREESQAFLKERGIGQRGLRDRILMAIDQDSGKYAQDLAKIIKAFASSLEPILLSKNCRKPVPTLYKWLKEQKLDGLFPLFDKAGYDNYEDILLQMCSLHPITSEILKNDVGILQSLIRSQILYRLAEGNIPTNKVEAKEYCRTVLVHKYDLITKYESTDKSAACTCNII
eukprot:TRINITY_DN7043_c0_g2_i4.p1 TRINITY_DN7043_c0_g2~~TRINITY_DN7043_c0_g2_i4.p1  ORF type:complete len:511 (+),score=105.57 TRINITY_DN7043_c0_g2_i4:85-1617(+)